MTGPKVVVLDYGSGNVRSAVRALERVGADVELTADRAAAEGCDGLVVPGVGAFAAVAEQLRAVRGDQIVDRRLAGGRPVLGICVGHQVMFERSTEHGQEHVEGLGEWPGVVERLPAEVVPHMGWNTVAPPAGTVLFKGVEDDKAGEAVKVVLVKKDPAVTEADVRAWCEANLTGYKRPKLIEFRTELPKTPVGKVLRRELRDKPAARA